MPAASGTGNPEKAGQKERAIPCCGMALSQEGEKKEEREMNKKDQGRKVLFMSLIY
jgi:hypothetical protein